MITLHYYTSSSTVKPEAIDDTSSAYTTYLRKNIKQDGGMYIYDEACPTKEEYAEYIRQQEEVDIWEYVLNNDFRISCLELGL